MWALRRCSSLVLAVALLLPALPAQDVLAQSLRDRFANFLDRDDESASDEPDAAEQSESAADAAAATAYCVQSGDKEEAAALSLLFGKSGDKGLVSSDIAEYLVGLCVPNAFSAQYSLNQYLLAKGAAYSFYSDRSLEELADYLEMAGVELGIKFEALRNDDALMAGLQTDNEIDKAAFLLNRNHELAEYASLFVPAIVLLEEEQRVEALAIASRVRSYALHSSYFLSRGMYVSQKMSGAMTDNVKGTAKSLKNRFRAFKNRSRSDPVNALSTASDEAEAMRTEANNELVSFSEFVARNGQAVLSTLSNTVNVVQSFDTDAAEIPTLTEDELDADVARLNAEWGLPAEFQDEEAYAAANTFTL
jgi:gas vesicle protein